MRYALLVQCNYHLLYFSSRFAVLSSADRPTKPSVCVVGGWCLIGEVRHGDREAMAGWVVF